ncbi:cytochrome c oxidase assembly protein [Kribbella sp. NBC_00709]|uniref:cytochrome c oxidase assembly protein n=1 Tax=Kribbella sp. NBC_00709 TaxID=2975972 RepID=UPI002E28429E|nr:cytochrome c oxidase assembly protein [Kribbella sp. NBC_00709]
MTISVTSSAARATRPVHKWLVRYVVLLAGVAIAIPMVVAVAVGADSYLSIARDDPGRTTSLVATGLRAVADLASLVTVGALASALLTGRLKPLREKGSRRQLEIHEWLEPKILRRAGAIWVAAAGLLVFVDSADSNGYSLSRLADGHAVRFALFSGDAGRAWMISCLAAIVAAATGMISVSWVRYLIALWAAVVGSLAPVVVGQVLVGPRHDFGSDAAICQTVAGQILFGVLVVQLLRLATARRVRVRDRLHWRQSAVLLLGVLFVGELVLAWVKLVGPSPLATSTARLELLRLLGLVLLASGLILTFRDKLVAGAATAATGAAAFVTGGLAMTRIPPPQFFVPTSISQIFFGFDLTGPPSVASLAGQWRPNLLFAVAAVVAVVAYLAAVLRVRRRGERWPILRTVAWVIGWVLVVAVTSSGLGKYSGTDFAVHMAVHMTLSMLVPLPLVLGGPITLALRALPAASKDQQAGPHEWIVAVLHSRALQALCHPLLVFGIYIGSYYSLYLTDAFGTLMKFHWAHQLMNAHFLLFGCLYFGLVIGVDPTPRRLPSLAKLGFLFAAMPFHAFFGVILMSGGTIVGKTFYEYLESPWRPDLAHTQQVAGGIAWAGGEIPLVIVVIVLALQWAIQDGKDARRIDRHLDSGLDDSYEAYNAMLERLARRTGADTGRSGEPS